MPLGGISWVTAALSSLLSLSFSSLAFSWNSHVKLCCFRRSLHGPLHALEEPIYSCQLCLPSCPLLCPALCCGSDWAQRGEVYPVLEPPGRCSLENRQNRGHLLMTEGNRLDGSVWPSWRVRFQAQTACVLSGECPPDSYWKAGPVWSWVTSLPKGDCCWA